MSFWREVFSEDGKASFSRLATGLLVVAAIAWVTVLILRNHALPDNLPGLAALVVAPYGLNKVGSAVASLKGDPKP